jgi:hypothetical protein
MDQKYIDKRKAELNQDSIKLKERFIEETVRLNDRFKADWNEIAVKVNQLEEEAKAEDKLNVK